MLTDSHLYCCVRAPGDIAIRQTFVAYLMVICGELRFSVKGKVIQNSTRAPNRIDEGSSLKNLPRPNRRRKPDPLANGH